MLLRREFQRLTVIDYFALLGEPRQPWVDEEGLRSKFFALSASVHPDRVHALSAAERDNAGERSTELNAAYACLREPKERLRHLIELHTGRKPAQVQQVPEALVDLFFEIGRVCRAADEFLKRKAAVTSPLLLAGLFEEGQAVSDGLRELQQQLHARKEQLLADVKQLNTRWQQELGALEAIQQTLSYLHRWSAQLQERIVSLAV
jgi:DnaJ-domain-containing protein 1